MVMLWLSCASLVTAPEQHIKTQVHTQNKMTLFRHLLYLPVLFGELHLWFLIVFILDVHPYGALQNDTNPYLNRKKRFNLNTAVILKRQIISDSYLLFQSTAARMLYYVFLFLSGDLIPSQPSEVYFICNHFSHLLCQIFVKPYVILVITLFKSYPTKL